MIFVHLLIIPASDFRPLSSGFTPGGLPGTLVLFGINRTTMMFLPKKEMQCPHSTDTTMQSKEYFCGHTATVHFPSMIIYYKVEQGTDGKWFFVVRKGRKYRFREL